VVPAGGDAAEANTAVVNHHYGLELSKVFGGGTMSSSDGQRFPVRGTSLSGRDMIIHRGRVLSTYTHVSDQWPTYGTKIIVPTAREAHFALDEFLGKATDLPITDHATDTHGVFDQLRAVRSGGEGADAADAGSDPHHAGA
jgi:TnpA family transposase